MESRSIYRGLKMATGAPDRLQLLQHELDEGWQLEPPVLEHLPPSCARHPINTFEFILSRKDKDGRRVIAVPDSPKLHQFLDKYHLPVVTL